MRIEAPWAADAPGAAAQIISTQVAPAGKYVTDGAARWQLEVRAPRLAARLNGKCYL